MIVLRRIVKRLGFTLVALLIVFAIAVAWPAPPAPLPDQEQDRMIANVRIIDVEDGTTGNRTSLRISDGLITAIGPDLKPVQGEQVLDGAVAISSRACGTCASTLSSPRRKRISPSGSRMAYCRCAT